jgi:hypothetical protein
MTKRGNPWDIPEWHAIQRESALVRHLLGSGATALGRANYADKVGEYYTAFFGLSIGLERLTKLILVADHTISHNGRMPAETSVRKYGHNLVSLTNAADAVARKHDLKLKYLRPTSATIAKIIDCLDAFADANRGRYANFASLGDPSLEKEEPIRKWWGEVAELILKEYYYGKPIQTQVEGRARLVDQLISPFTSVLHTDETGNMMQDVMSSSIRTGQTEIVQRYGRYYSLTLIRWLAEIFSGLASTASFSHNIDAFYGSWEHFQTYTVDESFLKTRKSWPLK